MKRRVIVQRKQFLQNKTWYNDIEITEKINPKYQSYYSVSTLTHKQACQVCINCGTLSTLKNLVNKYWKCSLFIYGSWDSVIEHRTHDWKLVNSILAGAVGEIFSSRVNFVCWLLFGIRSIPLLPQWHVKDPSHSAKNAGGRLHLNTHTPLTQRSRSGLTMPYRRTNPG